LTISTEKKDKKRGFRVYSKWDKVQNRQAEKTQKWQLNHFYNINSNTDYRRVNELYSGK